ncbi:MAG: hypothetical protein ACPGVG_01580 [Mycobacterium sp.]
MPHPLIPQTLDLIDEFITEVTDQAVPHHHDRIVSVGRREREAVATAGSA